jgi:hypothetical protein
MKSNLVEINEYEYFHSSTDYSSLALANVISKDQDYDCESSHDRYLSRDTASTAIGINPWYTPHSSEHCP